MIHLRNEFWPAKPRWSNLVCKGFVLSIFSPYIDVVLHNLLPQSPLTKQYQL